MKKLTDFQKNFLYVLRVQNDRKLFVKFDIYGIQFVSLENASKLKYDDAVEQHTKYNTKLKVVKLLTAIQDEEKRLSTH